LVRKLHFILPGAGFLFLLIILFLSRDGSGSQFEASLSLDNPTAEVDVGPGEGGIVHFTGILTCNITGIGQNAQTIYAELTLRARNWSAGISPFEIEIKPDDEKTVPFQASVKVPSFTSSSMTTEVVISGTAKLEPGGQTYSIEPVTGTIIIKPYLRIQLVGPPLSKRLKGGSTAYYDFEIRNEGNCPGFYKLSIENENDLIEEGFKIEIPRDEKKIVENGFEEVTVTVTAPDIDKPNDYDIKVIAMARLENAPETYDINDRTRYDYHSSSLYIRITPGGIYILRDYFFPLVIGSVVLLVVSVLIVLKKKKIW